MTTADVDGTRHECQLPAQIVPVSDVAMSIETKIFFREGMELLNLGQPSEAVSKLEKAVECSPQYSDAYVGLGMAYAMDSQIYPALDSFERAALLNPQNFYARFKLAQFYFKLRVPKKGYEEAARALECASTFEERKLVAHILQEERKREPGSLKRPTWDRPFTSRFLYVGAAVVMGVLALLIKASMH